MNAERRDLQEGRRKRNKRFEDALLKWQEYGNDIIERKPPNFLAQNKKPSKGTRIARASVKASEESEIVAEDEKTGNESSQKSLDSCEDEIQKLARSLTEDIRDFEEMQKRSAKIEKDLKELKERAKAVLLSKENKPLSH